MKKLLFLFQLVSVCLFKVDVKCYCFCFVSFIGYSDKICPNYSLTVYVSLHCTVTFGQTAYWFQWL